MSEADVAAGAREYRIEELARAAGVPVRTLRYYQERKLLPPPRREGRIGWYSAAHLARLRVITQLIDRGHTLGGTAELLSAWEQGYDLAELLGFERAVTAPWSGEAPAPVRQTVAELSARLGGQLTPEVLAEAVDLGYVEVDGDQVISVSARLLESTVALVSEGIPLPAILAAGRDVQAGLDRLALLFVALFYEHVVAPGGSAPPPSDVTKLTEKIERLRPVARAVIDAEFGRAMERCVRAAYGEFMRLIGARDGQTPGGGDEEAGDRAGGAGARQGGGTGGRQGDGPGAGQADGAGGRQGDGPGAGQADGAGERRDPDGGG